MADPAPPPVRLGDRAVVAVDVRTVSAAIVFRPEQRQARVSARVDFTLGPDDGCPALDLRQSVDAVTLDGSSLPPDAFGHQDLGGGDEAEMRVLDRPLAAGSRHRLALEYRLGEPAAAGAQPIGWDGASRGVTFDFWMSDLYPGRYLEMWLPANLCHDRFRLELDIAIEGHVPHTLICNGTVDEIDPGRWRVRYPARFTSLSPMLVIVPADDVLTRRRTVRLAGRRQPIVLLTAGAAGAGTDLAACEADIASWLTANA